MLGGAFRLLVTLYAPIPSEASNSPVGAPYETRLFFYSKLFVNDRSRGAQGFGQKCVPRNRMRSVNGGFLDLKKQIKKPLLAAFFQLERLG